MLSLSLPRWSSGNPYLQLTARLVTGVLAFSRTGGRVPMTYTNATARTIEDFEGKITPVLSGGTRHRGCRRVRNIINVKSEDFLNAAWNAVSLTKTNATTLTFTGVSNLCVNTIAGSLGNGRQFRVRALISGSVGSLVNLFLFDSATGTKGAGMQVTMTATPTVYSFLATTGAAVEAYQFNIENRALLSIPIGTANMTVVATEIQIEDVTGQANQNPSEYVSVGVLSSPFHNNYVDGVRYFQTFNGNTVAANIVTEAVGLQINTTTCTALGLSALIPALLWDAKGPAGYLSEGAGVQLVTPTASIRDLTNAAWTKTTLTTALNSIGADGVANSATRCTATAGNALVLQTLVAAASSRTVSFLIKRVTGTGNIELTQDGTTFTNINAELQAGVYIRVSLNVSILNASFGIRIVTSGDAIDVDMSQFEAGPRATSRMLSAGAVRNADVLIPTFAFPNLVGSLYFEAGFSGNNSINQNTFAAGSPAEGNVLYLFTGQASTFDGTTDFNLLAGSPSTTTMNRMSIAWSGTAAKGCVNGTLGIGVTTDGNYNIPVTFGIGCRTDGTGQPSDPIRNLEIYNIPLTDAQQVARGA